MDLSAGSIDVRHWYASELGEHVTYALRAAFADDPPMLMLPIQWDFGTEPHSDGYGGKVPKDPLTLYLTLPLGTDESAGNVVIYSCSLEDVVDDLIDGHVVNGKVESEDARDICRRVAARLRELADKLEQA